jgi:hypothetical protein
VRPARKGWLGWAAALSVVLVASGTVVLSFRRSPPPAKAPDAPAAQRLLPEPKAKLLALPKPPRGPSVPRWALEGAEDRAGIETVRDQKTLPNGVEAVMFAGKSSYPSSAPVEVHLELQTPDGQPLVGRADLQLTAFDALAGGSEGISLNFAERVDEPGVYDALIAAPKSWKRVSVNLPVTETGNANEPGRIESVTLEVDHSGPASITNVIDARVSQNGTEIVVGVTTERPGRAAVRAELKDGEGQSFGDVLGVADLHEGNGKVTLAFPTMTTSHPSVAHAFYLADLTLFLDEKAADFRTELVPIVLRNAEALAKK